MCLAIALLEEAMKTVKLANLMSAMPRYQVAPDECRSGEGSGGLHVGQAGSTFAWARAAERRRLPSPLRKGQAFANDHEQRSLGQVGKAFVP